MLDLRTQLRVRYGGAVQWRAHFGGPDHAGVTALALFEVSVLCSVVLVDSAVKDSPSINTNFQNCSPTSERCGLLLHN